MRLDHPSLSGYLAAMPHPKSKPASSDIGVGSIGVVSKGNQWMRWSDVYHELLRRPWRFTVSVLFCVLCQMNYLNKVAPALTQAQTRIRAMSSSAT